MTRISRRPAVDLLPFAERFDREHGPFATEADRVITFIEAYCILGSGADAGRPMRLRDWQRDLVRRIFAARDGRRRFRIAYIGMPRKNGKSTLAAALALYALVLDEPGGQVYSAAGDRAQAAIVHNTARKMAAAHPELAALIKPFQRVLENVETGSIYRVLSSDAPLQHGLSPSFVVFDEVFVQPDRRLWDALSLATGAWRQPLIVAITTAGWDRDSLAYQLYEHGRDGDDPTFYFRWFTAPAELAYDDPEAWRAANPALGDFLHLADFESAIRTTPESEFARFRLNTWTATATAWLPAGAWDACADPDMEVLEDEPIVVGFDGSFSGDSTALVACTVEAPHRLWVLEAWEKPPDVSTWRVPILEVEDRIEAICGEYNVIEVACDPFRWQASMARLENAGCPIVEYRTGSRGQMGPATVDFYEAVVNGALVHDGDARLARHVRNTAVRYDALGPRIQKDTRDSPRKIDLAVCAVVALDRARFRAAELAKPAPQTFAAWA